ncbi:hypothetical protein GCM10020369_08130 [Cryptosporangium minutisporangium]|uniref:Uncharacterized protein n=2 Tax=Cryptosporangium minutisporangium TaxID=113569 RepID=A0ABP6SRK7_9ACTN
MTALILGFFASAWFAWAQEKPPETWKKPLMIAGALSLVVAAIGAFSAWRHWNDGSALSEPGAMRRYGIIAGVEFGIAAVGSIVLVLSRHRPLIPAWICLVVGVHFWPMASVLKNPSLLILGAILCVVAVAAVLLARRSSLLPSAYAGVGAGTALLGFACWGAVWANS